MLLNVNNHAKDLHCCELFAGVKTVARGFQLGPHPNCNYMDGFGAFELRRLGMKAATYEINDDGQYQDILDPLGFVFALSLCIRLFKEALKGHGS